MELAIRVANVSKLYHLGARQQAGYATLRESLGAAVAAPIRRLRQFYQGDRTGLHDAQSDEHWALKDVSFEIRPGEAIGIIGRNGAGKSTLLKILSRITSPTDGRVRIRGRLGSLLEVGTGFHPELTGRENVFLYGAIIGMGRQEIARKFDAIVDFAEIDRFIDTPVKRYSSGMYVRLAFAVAAHMEPDILLIDEVLSVGDLAFQRKCMEHTKRLLESDATLLFVSHNMFSIKALCPRSVYLSKGKVVFDGATEEAVCHYDQDGSMEVANWAEKTVGSDPSQCPISISSMETLDDEGQSRTLFKYGDRIRIRLHYEVRKPIREPNFTVAMVRSDAVACCNYNTSMDGFSTALVSGSGTIELRTPPLKLVSELYALHVLVWDTSFQHLYCAQVGKSIHISHPDLSTEFGVFHEPAEWCWRN
ncbi:lipopolysaccharide transport system ATP-binding protein [Singulisphaera sp. GP187]|uniref:ABC transporter ATP-binding protein n=1 Tax=Singulisphaera sp. GP187 TaxID=1882752 RepID=UPI0009265D4E|nr:ABC transporter ATP-binding protein [Singulisphaera sp. GP187]SIO61554.1 lipopolysaccharide transport system ATP-binding protein [Singulisphaera sp. GP187]